MQENQTALLQHEILLWGHLLSKAIYRIKHRYYINLIKFYFSTFDCSI